MASYAGGGISYTLSGYDVDMRGCCRTRLSLGNTRPGSSVGSELASPFTTVSTRRPELPWGERMPEPAAPCGVGSGGMVGIGGAMFANECRS